MAIPLKQGLKPNLAYRYIEAKKVDMAIPLKQGLKLLKDPLSGHRTELIWQFH